MNPRKNIIVIVAIISCFYISPVKTSATPPAWAPANGYRENARHIYFPQQNMYYDLQKEVYMYNNGGIWLIIKSVPAIYKNVNLNIAPQVQLFLDTNDPFSFNDTHKSKYGYMNKGINNDLTKNNKNFEKSERKRKKEMKELDKQEKKRNK
ncbi:MAG: Protein of unknown function precursor [Bacteroidetes bacterium]|nr:Protein of unknown function precursor [Bacteroidota bacterium]